MSTQHVVHRIYEPGLPGDGFTTAEAAQVRADLDKVDAIDWVSADWFSHPTDAAAAAGPEGHVRFSNGVDYVYEDPILFQEGQTFSGKGRLFPGSSAAAFQAANYDGVRYVTIRDVFINGGNTCHTLIDMRGVGASLIERVQIINALQYGVRFGGDPATGGDNAGWSNRLLNSRIGTTVGSSGTPGAGVYLDGMTTGGADLVANFITIMGNVIATNGLGYGHAIYIQRGGENIIVGNDMGYGNSTAIVLGVHGRRNYFAGNRVEKAGGSVRLMDGAYENMFIGDRYGGVNSGYSGFNVSIVNGANNYFHPAEASFNGKGWFGEVLAGSGNVLEFRGKKATGATTDVPVAVGATNQNFAKWEVRGTGNMYWGSGAAAPDVALYRSAANVLNVASGDSLALDGGAWNTGTLQLGAYHLWVDTSGRLRIKSGAPTSATDGTIVGVQG